MTTHILAKSLATIEDKGAELGDLIETKFSDLRTAVANGNRKAQETIIDELHGLVATSRSLITAAHDHAKALMPAAHVDKAEPVSAETTVNAAKKR